MKTLYRILIFILIPATAMLLAFTAGPPAGNTGSPLDGQDCSFCHTPLPAGHVQNWISSNIPTAGYTPGETYTVAVSALTIVAVKMGFQITSETQVAKAGTFIITDDTRTQLKNNFTVTHTAQGTTVTGLPNTWTMSWMAPESGTGPVTFYAAVNETNNDNSNVGDLIYVSSLTVQEFSIGIPETLDQQLGQIYPNPVNSYFNLVVPVHTKIKIVDQLGRVVMEQLANTASMKIDVSNLESGIYFVQIMHEDENALRRFVKR